METSNLFHKNHNQKSRKAQEAVSKYLYNHSKINAIPQNQIFETKFTLKAMTPSANKQLIYAEYQKAYISGMPQHILWSVLYRHYLNNTSIKIYDNISQSTTFEHPYLPISSTAYEILQFVIQQIQVPSNSITKEVKKMVPEKKFYFNKKSCEKKEAYKIYVIHHCHIAQIDGKQIIWENFVQTFQFSNQNIKYKMICSSYQETGFFSSLTSKLTKYNQLNEFVKMYSNQQRINKIIGSALQLYDEALILNKIQIDKNDPVYGPQHNRLSHLPSQHYQKFQNIKQQLKQYNLKDNDICRFLIVNKYNASETISHLKQYKSWILSIQKRSSLYNFQYYYAADIYTYLGQDYHGFPVILNKAANVRVDEFDADQYCHFFIYWLEIFLVSKMRGNVDQLVAIADLKNLSSANFKLSITKRNISQGLRYCPERQLRLFAVNVNSFVKFCATTFIYPLLPTNSLQKIILAGHEKSQIRETIQKYMSLDVLPKYMGGNNDLGNLNQNVEEQIF